MTDEAIDWLTKAAQDLPAPNLDNILRSLDAIIEILPEDRTQEWEMFVDMRHIYRVEKVARSLSSGS